MSEIPSRGRVHIAAPEFGRVCTGVPTTSFQQAAAARRWGWWCFAQHMTRQLRAYLFSVLTYDLGQLVLHLAATGLALGVLVDANTPAVDGVSYLVCTTIRLRRLFLR